MSKKLFTRVVPVMVVAAAMSMAMLAGCSMQDEAEDAPDGVIEETIVEDGSGVSGGDATKVMTEDEIKAVVFKDAGVAATDATNVKVTMKTQDGVDVYEVTFDAKGTHYDYTVDAKTGAVIEFEEMMGVSGDSGASSDSKDEKSSSSK